MKRFNFLFVILTMGLFVGDAMAKNCLVRACPNDDDVIGVNEEYMRTAPGSRQCYSCDSDNGAFDSSSYCTFSSVIGVNKDYKFSNMYGREVFANVYQCVDIPRNLWDQWRVATPGEFCNDSPIQADNVANANKTLYAMKDASKTTKSTSGDSDSVYSGGTMLCKYVACQEGYEPADYKQKCVKSAAKCAAYDQQSKMHNNMDISVVIGTSYTNVPCPTHWKSTSGTVTAYNNDWAKAKMCNMICEADGKWNVTIQTCAASNQIPSTPDKKSCVDKPKVVIPPKTQCENHNKGKSTPIVMWNGSACVCVDSNKTYDPNHTLVCVEKPQTCPSDASGTPPNCICKESTKSYDADTNSCVLTSSLICEESFLTELRAGKDTYKDSVEIVKEIDAILALCDGKKASEARTRWNALKATTIQTWTATQTTIISSTKTITDKWSDINGKLGADGKISAWTSADGKFNTARLTSDSIAGVVLGTAGGLITSSVIKKNQVKKGFEDISCMVGGQTVAEYGDEFVVGVNQ